MSTPIKCGKGVNKDLLPSELEPGYWSDMLNFRSRNGFEERFGGATALNLNGASGTYDDDGHAACFLFPYASGENYYAIYGDDSKAYAILNATNYEITRYINARTISSITRIGANTAEVTTATAHGLSTADVVTHFGATEDGYNEANAAITVMSSTVYRYTTTNAIAGNATVVGKYSVVTSGAYQDFNVLDRYPTGGTLNGVFFIHYPPPIPLVGGGGHGLFYWGGDTSIRLRQAPFAVSSTATAVRAFKNYLVALDGDDVYWTDAAEPGAFPTTMAASATNDAGQSPLAETPGNLVDCLPLGEVNILYKRDSIWVMRYIGGNDVFSFSRLPGSDGLYAPWCVVDTPVGHVFVTQNLDIRIHAGGASKSIADGRVRKFFASDFDYADTYLYKRLFVTTNPEKSEVWICYPTVGSDTGCDKALVWNWESDTWGIFYIGGVTGTVGYSTNGIAFAAFGLWNENWTKRPSLVLLTNAALSKFAFKVVSDTATNAAASTLERTGIGGEDHDQMFSIDESRWNFDGTGTATIYHGSSKTADGTVSWASGATYTIGTTDKANGRATQGRFGGVKLSTSSQIAVRSYELTTKAGGKR